MFRYTLDIHLVTDGLKWAIYYLYESKFRFKEQKEQ